MTWQKGKYSEISVKVDFPGYNQELFTKALVTRPFKEMYGEVILEATGPRQIRYDPEDASEIKKFADQKYIDDCKKHRIMPFSSTKLKIFENRYIHDWNGTWIDDSARSLEPAYKRKVLILNAQGGRINRLHFEIGQFDNEIFSSDALPMHFANGYEVSRADLTLKPGRHIHYQEMDPPWASTKILFNERQGLEVKIGTVLNEEERNVMMTWINSLVLNNFHEKTTDYNSKKQLEEDRRVS
jgi:hypothetical protein